MQISYRESQGERRKMNAENVNESFCSLLIIANFTLSMEIHLERLRKRHPLSLKRKKMKLAPIAIIISSSSSIHSALWVVTPTANDEGQIDLRGLISINEEFPLFTTILLRPNLMATQLPFFYIHMAI